MNLRKLILYISLLIVLILGVVFYLSYDAIFLPSVNISDNEHELFIYPGESYDDLTEKLKNDSVVTDLKSFNWVAGLMSYGTGNKIPPGRYVIPTNISNKEFISILRSGNQTPVNLTFNNVRTLAELSGKLDNNILLDSLEILNYLQSDAIEKYDYSQETLMSAFIPNTYRVYWDISPDDLMKRILKEHNKFWNDDRKQKAKQLGLSPTEVYTLASIVDKESLKKSEKPRIAGVYLNRLKKGILLQADPTVVFAVGDFSLRRVLNKHLEIDSPYNTYKYAGLPPGPISMSSISGIDSVLDYEEHNFLYFCAKPESNGEHAFAKTLAGHNRNAAIYRNWLNNRGIR